MMNRPEHLPGWRERGEVDGLDFLVEARHRSVTRLPRPHEMARQAARGTPPFTPIRETHCAWAVVARGRMVCMLEENPSGSFRAGSIGFPRLGIMEAGAAAIRRMAPGMIAAAATVPRGPGGR